MSRDYQFETKVLLNKNKDEKGAVSPPIYQTNAFEYETAEELEKYLRGGLRDIITPGLVIRPIISLKKR